jgi:hypothetical protein
MVKRDAAMLAMSRKKMHQMVDTLFAEAGDWDDDASSFAIEARFSNPSGDAFTLEVKLDCAPPPADDDEDDGDGFRSVHVEGHA